MEKVWFLFLVKQKQKKAILILAKNKKIKISNFVKRKGSMMRKAMGRAPKLATANAAYQTLRAILNDTKEQLCCAVWNEKYKSYMSSLAKIGKKGVVGLVHKKVNKEEEKLLQKAAKKIQKQLESIF